MFVPSKTFRITYGDSWIDLAVKNRNFALTKIIFINQRKVILPWFFLQKINIQITLVFLIFQNFWSFRSIRNIQITTNCSVFDKFSFLCIVCLFRRFYGFIWRVFAIEKLEYSRYNAKMKYEWVCNSTYSSDLLSYTNGSH